MPTGGTVAFAWSPDPADAPGRVGLGLGCTLSAADAAGAQVTQFSQPVRLEIPLSAADLSGVNPETVAIFWQDVSAQTWQALPTFIDETQQIAVAEVDRPGSCALLGQPLADGQAPVTSIEVDGPGGAAGVWAGAVTVALTSEDVGGGSVAEIEYSLDAGRSW
ncbi:MAG: hypothetical protein M5U34_31775 [Chloroflexi bacterium]|nr:hypothetical protein [Chloroflexota bacterium]